MLTGKTDPVPSSEQLALLRQQAQDINQQIADLEQQAQSQLDTNPWFQHRVAQEVAKEIVVQQVKTDYHKSRIDSQEEIEAYTNKQYSTNTRRNYKCALDKLQAYTLQHDLDILDFTPRNANEFIQTLLQTYSSRTARLTITACAGFYKHLIHQYPDTLKTNPFLLTKLPRINDYYQKDWVLDHDLQTLLKHFKDIKRLDLYALTYLRSKYGWRIGILTNLEINPTTLRYTSTSKGSQKEGKLTRQDYQLILDSNILNTPISTLRIMFSKHAKRLHTKGLLSCSPSPHDLRRYHIDKEFDKPVQSAKDVLDIAYKYHDNPMTTFSHYVNRNIKRSA